MVVAAAVDAVALVVLHRAPARAVTELSGGRSGPVDVLAVDVASATLFLVAGWIAVALTVTALGAVPGSVGRVSDRLSRVLVPAAARRVVAGAAGLGVFLAPVAASAVSTAATPGPPTPTPTASTAPTSPAASPGSTVPVDTVPGETLPAPTWPTGGATTGRPTTGSTPSGAGRTPRGSQAPTDHPTRSTTPVRATPPAHPHRPARTTEPGHTTEPGRSTSPSHTGPLRTDHPASGDPARRTTRSATTSPDVTVRPGDSLWLIAQRRLGAHPTDSRTAGLWPELYRLNRTVIGDDPDLIRPGQRLRLPGHDVEEHFR